MQLTQEDLALLGHCPFFRGCSPTLIGQVSDVEGADLVGFSAGQVVYSPQDFRRCLGVLLSGQFQVTKGTLAVSTLEPGELFGAAALYSVDPGFFLESKAEYRRRRDTVISRLRKIPGVVVEEPMGAFYVMASLPVDDSDKFQRWLLESFSDNGDTVMFAPGAPFYETPGKGINEVRIAYVLKQEDLERAMEVLASGIAQYQRKVMKVKALPTE